MEWKKLLMSLEQAQTILPSLLIAGNILENDCENYDTQKSNLIIW